MELQILIVIAVMAAVLALVVLSVNVRTRSKEEDELRELGFVVQDPPPAVLTEAIRDLYSDEDSKTETRITRCLRLRVRTADVFFTHFHVGDSEKHSYRQAMRSLQAVNPAWELPRITVLTLKEPEGLAERMMAKTLEMALGKELGRVDISGFGDFAQRATVFGKDEHRTRHLLTDAVRKALLALPHGLFEAHGTGISLGRPAQAGPGKWSQEEWRMLTDALRTLAEEISHSPASRG